MKLNLRCSSLSLLPSDASGIFVEMEVCDWREIWRSLILEADEATLREMFGDESFDRDAAAGHAAVQRALAEFGARKKA